MNSPSDSGMRDCTTLIIRVGRESISRVRSILPCRIISRRWSVLWWRKLSFKIDRFLYVSVRLLYHIPTALTRRKSAQYLVPIPSLKPPEPGKLRAR